MLHECGGGADVYFSAGEIRDDVWARAAVDGADVEGAGPEDGVGEVSKLGAEPGVYLY